MGKHGERARLWPAILGIVFSLMAIAAFILLIIWNPHWAPKG